MAKNFIKRFNDLEKKIKHKHAIEIVRFVKPENEKYLVEVSNLKNEIGTLISLSELDNYPNSITFIEAIFE